MVGHKILSEAPDTVLDEVKRANKWATRHSSKIGKVV